MIRLPLSERYEEDVIMPSSRQPHDYVEAPCTGTGSELRLLIEDLLDVLSRVGRDRELVEAWRESGLAVLVVVKLR